MKISAQIAVFFAGVFAIICFSVAVTGFTSLGEITDPVRLADAKGFAWFWAFLGVVAVLFGVLSLWIIRTEREEE
ncbi:MAG TPA: hypothetical protein VM532_17680 [Burkholderiales bacterium]|nr:hypothetical protein [Burkholderiales bacterium]